MDRVALPRARHTFLRPLLPSDGAYLWELFSTEAARSAINLGIADPFERLAGALAQFPAQMLACDVQSGAPFGWLAGTRLDLRNGTGQALVVLDERYARPWRGEPFLNFLPLLAAEYQLRKILLEVPANLGFKQASLDRLGLRSAGVFRQHRRSASGYCDVWLYLFEAELTDE